MWHAGNGRWADLQLYRFRDNLAKLGYPRDRTSGADLRRSRRWAVRGGDHLVVSERARVTHDQRRRCLGRSDRELAWSATARCHGGPGNGNDLPGDQRGPPDGVRRLPQLEHGAGRAQWWTRCSTTPAIRSLWHWRAPAWRQRWAPHRLRDPRVVSAADRIVRAAAPGSLLSVLGARVTAARIGDLRVPVLASGEMESQIQVPFEVAEPAIALAMDSSSGPMQAGVAVKPASPSIFVDRDGSPLLMDAESGLMLDASTPARPGTRVQILATGLGRVTPGWPSGLAAPLQNPPRVSAPVRVYLDRESLEVKRATLAPGYVGMYLIEVELPRIVNSGTSELYLEIESEQSNRVQLWLEP